MKRDFSDSAYNELISLVEQVESEKWCDFTDWIGDRWYDFEEWIGVLNIGSSIDNVNSYHKKVIDKNNASKDTIDGIFADVKNIDQNYATRFAAYKTLVDEFTGLVGQFSDVVSPANGSFSADKFEPGALKASISSYEDVEKYLKLIGGDGLSEEDLLCMDKMTRANILRNIAEVLFAAYPSIKVGQKVELPFGPGITIYYSVDSSIEGNSDIDINLIIEDHRLKFEGLSFSTSSDGSFSFKLDANTAGSFGVSAEWKSTRSNIGIGGEDYLAVDGKNTYAISFGVGMTEGVFIEESIKTEIGGGSVTSAIGLKESADNNWALLPVPETAEAPSSVTLPTLEAPNWGHVSAITEGIAEGVVGGIAVSTVLEILLYCLLAVA